MKLELSKESKSQSIKHVTRLLLILLLVCSVLFLVVALDYRQLVYPPLHRDQSSPHQFVEKVSKKLPVSLVKPQVIEHGSRDKKQIALTFDADMTPPMYLLLKKGFVKSWYNRDIKETLDREHVKATIFLGGLWVKAYSKEASDLAHDPLIEIGNHSYNHHAFKRGCFELGVIDDAADRDEVGAAQTAIFAATGTVPKYFRFPGGCFDKIDIETIAKMGLKIVHWDVVSGDGFNKNADSIVRKVESGVQNGSIVVFHIHDGTYAPKTNDALIRIIPDLRKRGFEFVTVSEMIDETQNEN